MNDRFTKLMSAFLLILFATACSKREVAVVESKSAKALITTFTVDSLFFSIKLNNTPWVDSLLSPVTSAVKQFSFYDTVVHLQVYEKNNFNGIIIDTNINIHLGLNYFNIVQLKGDQKPYIPMPPAEPLPASGYCKVKFVYTAPPNAPFMDSVKCEILVDTSKTGTGLALKPVDTVVLSRYQFTDGYYIVSKRPSSFRVRVSDPANNSFIQLTSSEDADTYSDFNTINLVAVKNSAGQPFYDLVRAF